MFSHSLPCSDSQDALETFLFLQQELQAHVASTPFYVGAGDLNSSLHVFASIFLPLSTLFRLPITVLIVINNLTFMKIFVLVVHCLCNLLAK